MGRVPGGNALEREMRLPEAQPRGGARGETQRNSAGEGAVRNDEGTVCSGAGRGVEAIAAAAGIAGE